MSKTSDSKYYLNIHHRSITVNTNLASDNIEVGYSPGHFFVSLQQNEDKKFFGKYSQGNSLGKKIYSKEVINAQKEELEVNKLEELKEQTGEEYHSFKSIILTEEQYNSAHKFAMSKIDGTAAPENYILGINDCTDFVQQVYNQAGLPLYFTAVFAHTELIKLGSAAAINVLRKYGASDAMALVCNSIESTSKEALAKSLNINIDCICQNTPDVHVYADFSGIPTFRVLHDKIKLPQVINVDSNSFLPIEIKGSQQPADPMVDPFDFSAMVNMLPLAQDQRQRASRDMSDLFTGMMQNPYEMGLSDPVFTPQELFPQPDNEVTQWAEELTQNSEEMLSNMGFGIFGSNVSNHTNYIPHGHSHSQQLSSASTASTGISGHNPDIPLD